MVSSIIPGPCLSNQEYCLTLNSNLGSCLHFATQLPSLVAIVVIATNDACDFASIGVSSDAYLTECHVCFPLEVAVVVTFIIAAATSFVAFASALVELS